jgi:hypothetical protein
MTETPFDNVEGAHEYIGLLVEAVQQARAEVAQDLAAAAADPDPRPLEALRLVAYKLERLEVRLASSRRLLNDLRRLRRLLLGEPDAVAASAGEEEEDDPIENV